MKLPFVLSCSVLLCILTSPPTFCGQIVIGKTAIAFTTTDYYSTLFLNHLHYVVVHNCTFLFPTDLLQKLESDMTKSRIVERRPNDLFQSMSKGKQIWKHIFFYIPIITKVNPELYETVYLL